MIVYDLARQGSTFVILNNIIKTECVFSPQISYLLPGKGGKKRIRVTWWCKNAKKKLSSIMGSQ